MKLIRVIFVCIIVSSLNAYAEKPSWDISFVIDQSPSMMGADTNRYALLIPAVLADLSSSKDRITVIGQDGCKSAPCTGSITQLKGSKKRFKEQLDKLPDDSSFTSQVHTALLRHQSSTGYDKSLISLVYDDDAQDSQVEAEIRNMISKSGQDGFVFEMGSANKFLDIFGRNRGAQVTDSFTLLGAYSYFFKLLLNAKAVPTGQSDPANINISLSPDIEESWIVIFTNENISKISKQNGNPGASKVTISPPDTGFNYPKTNDQNILSYKLIYLLKPTPGQWKFSAKTKSSSVSWLVLNFYSLPIINVTIDGKIYQNKKINCSLDGCQISFKLKNQKGLKGLLTSRFDQNHKFTITCDMMGICTGTYKPKDLNDKLVEVNIENIFAQNKLQIEINPIDRPNLLDADCPNLVTYLFPTHKKNQIKVSYFFRNSSSRKSPLARNSDVTLSFLGNNILPVKSTVRQVSEQDLLVKKNVQVSDWVNEYIFEHIRANQPQKIDGDLISVLNGKQKNCPIKFDFYPTVDPKIKINKIGEFQRCATNDQELLKNCNRCGGCIEQKLSLDFNKSSISDDVESQILFDSLLSANSTLFINGQNMKQGDSIKNLLKAQHKQPIQARLCSDNCLKTNVKELIKLKVKVNNVFSQTSKEPVSVDADDQIMIEYPSVLQMPCPQYLPIDLPTDPSSMILPYFYYQSAGKSQPSQQTNLSLDIDGTIYQGKQIGFRKATNQDLKIASKAVLGDWVAEYEFAAVKYSQPKSLQAVLTNSENGAFQQCKVPITFSPTVQLKMKILKNDSLFQSCEKESQDFQKSCSGCGGCNMKNITINLTGSTLSNDVKGRLSLKTNLPNGTKLFIGEKELSTTSPTNLDLLAGFPKPFTAKLCTDNCVKSTTNSPIHLGIDVEKVFTNGSIVPTVASTIDRTEFDYPAVLQASCTNESTYILPTKQNHIITEVFHFFGSKGKSKPPPIEMSIMTKDKKILAYSINIRQVTANDIKKDSRAQIGEWLAEAQFDLREEKANKWDSKLMFKAGSAYKLCPISLEFLPTVDLQISVDKNPLKPDECSATPSNLLLSSDLIAPCANSGGCTQDSFTISYKGSQLSNIVTGLISLETPLSKGIKLFIEGKELNRGKPIQATFDPTNADQKFTGHICADYCPKTSNSIPLNFDFKVDRVFTNDSKIPTIAQSQIQTSYHVRQPNWWICWLPEMIITAKIIALLFFIYGFYYPTRFPRSSHRNGIPHTIMSATQNRVHHINLQTQSLRRAMPKIRWYRNDVANFTIKHDLLVVDHSIPEGVISVQLKYGKAYITSTSDMYKVNYIHDGHADNYTLKQNDLLEKNKLYPLDTNKIYYIKNSEYWVRFDA